MKSKRHVPRRKTVDFLNRHFAVLFLIGYLALHGFYHRPPGDSTATFWGTENHNIAASIVEGRGFEDPYAPLETGPSAWVAPPFPYLLAGVFWLVVTKTVAAARLGLFLQVLVFGGTFWLLYSIVQRTFSTNCAKLATLIWLISPDRIGLTSSHLSEVGFSAFSVLLAIFAVVRFQESPTRRAAALAGLAIGFAILCLPVVVLALPGFAWTLYTLARGRILRPWAGPLVAFMICVAVLTPWIIRNYVVFGTFVFIKSNFGHTLYSANNDNSAGAASSVYTSEAERNLMQQMGEIEYNRYSLQRALAWTRDHKKEFLARCVRRALAFWVVNPAAGLKQWIWYLYQIPLLIVSTVGLWHRWRRNPVTILTLAILIIVPIVYYLTGFAEQHRFRLPFEALLIIFCSSLIYDASTRHVTSQVMSP